VSILVRLLLIASATCAMVGCEPTAVGSGGKTSSATRADRDEAEAPQPPKFAPPPSADAVPVVEVNDVADVAKVGAPREVIRERARAGVSDRGNYDGLIFTTPLTANFSIQEQIVFDSQIPNAMKAYERVANRKPNSHQEFMTEIIRKNNIRLPPLPQNCRFVYDPELGELMVERPKPAD